MKGKAKRKSSHSLGGVHGFGRLLRGSKGVRAPTKLQMELLNKVWPSFPIRSAWTASTGPAAIMSDVSAADEVDAREVVAPEVIATANEDITAEVEDVKAEVEVETDEVKVDKTFGDPKLVCKVDQCHMTFGSDLSQLHAHHQTHDIGEPDTLLHTGRSCWHGSLSPAAACEKAPTPPTL